MLVIYFGLLFVLNFVQEVKLENICGPDEFPCDDGSCVEKYKWCNTKEDCNDDSDENYCLLKTTFRKNPNRCNETKFFLCDDGQCIPAVGRCDGFTSCFDNSDEENCNISDFVSSSTMSTTLSSGVEEQSIQSSVNNSKFFTNLYYNESSMQAGHASHMQVETISGTSIGESNTSQNLSNTGSKGLDHSTFQPHVSNTTIVSKNITNRVARNLVITNHREPLEFRDISGGILNMSRNEPNALLMNKSESLNSVPFNNSASEQGTKEKMQVTLAVSNQNNESRRTVSHHVHAKLQSSENTMNAELDLHKGYIKLQTRYFRKSNEKALQWLIENKDQDYGWGEETARALTTLWMGGYSFEKSDMAVLMSKQLHLKLFTLMSRNETKKIPLGELALYINALSASCDDPRNFHGQDLVSILRHRTNDARKSAKFVTPFVYLVLCLNDELSDEDVVRVQDMLHDSNMTKTDTKAVISLAAICISRTPKFSNIGLEQVAARKLYSEVTARGLPKNIYELSLLTQALHEVKINQDLWNRSEAMRRITDLQEGGGSFGDILSTYYAVPTLCGKSLLWIGHNCHRKDEGLAPVEVLKNGKNEKIYARYSLLFGNPVEMSQSLMIKVETNTSFMDIMRIAATVNPAYRFKYEENEGKIKVYSIGGIANDAERGLYWAPYRSLNSSFVPIEEDIRSFIPAHEQSVAYWRKPIL